MRGSLCSVAGGIRFIPEISANAPEVQDSPWHPDNHGYPRPPMTLTITGHGSSAVCGSATCSYVGDVEPGRFRRDLAGLVATHSRADRLVEGRFLLWGRSPGDAELLRVAGGQVVSEPARIAGWG